MNIDNLIFKPIIPLGAMIVFSIFLLIIVLINRKHIISRILIIILLLIISQRPMLKNEDDVSYVLNLDIVFVVDTTVSMNAIDIIPNNTNVTRLDRAKEIIKYIMKNLPGSNYAVITYNNDAYLKYPFTNDNAVILDVIDALKIVEPNYAIGSAHSLPAEFMKMLFTSSENKDNTHDAKRQKILFFISDGELNNQEILNNNLAAYDGINEMIDNGAIIGMGTPEGSKIRITDTINKNKLVDSNNFLLDNSKNPPTPAISKLNEINLREISDKLELDYFNEKDNLLDNKIDEIKKNVNQSEDDDVKNDKDLYYYFSMASIILMLYELLYYRRNEL